MKASVTINIEGDFNLDIEEIFPDGVPPNWTNQDVVDAIRSTTNVQNLILEWNLIPEVTVQVHKDERSETIVVWNGF